VGQRATVVVRAVRSKSMNISMMKSTVSIVVLQVMGVVQAALMGNTNTAQELTNADIAGPQGPVPAQVVLTANMKNEILS